MKSTEVYRVIRDILKPWCKVHGFKRTKSGMLGWYKQVEGEFLVFWFQCSMDGWDEIVGSKFIVEFQFANEPVIGVGKIRKRLPELLEETHLEIVREIQNGIISKLSPPPKDYPVLQISADVTEWYLAKFKPITSRYKNTDDIWLRYKTENDVRQWASFVLDHLPFILQNLRQV
jgi:hypothetical protein